MLINFTVENFRSFGEEQTLNMVASGLKDHPDHCVPIPGTDKSALRCGVIYGANASGKSNLVKAIEYAQGLILGRAPLGALAQNGFRFSQKEEPASFEFRYLSDGQLFVYGFAATKAGVLEEWLDAGTKKGAESKVFTRSGSKIDGGHLGAFGKAASETTSKVLRALNDLGVKEDQLLLNRIVEQPERGRGELLGRAVRWFSQSLTVIPPESYYGALLDDIAADDGFRRFCGEFLKRVGTGIDDLSVHQVKLNANTLPKSMVEELSSFEGSGRASIGGPGVEFELDPEDPAKVVSRSLLASHRLEGQAFPIPFLEESDGTQRCLNLLPALFHLTQGAKVYVIDELDRSLHPLLCHALLKLYLATRPETPGQMIVTTHEAHLLDLELLRPDEIWFVEKDRRQQSRLSSLSDWELREDLRIKDGYLQGRFGGIPFIGDAKKLMDMIQRSSNGARDEREAAH